MEAKRDAGGRFVKGSKGRIGVKHSEVTKRLISQNRKGKAVGEFNPHWNAKIHAGKRIECACGCGTLIAKYDYRGRLKKYVVGHTRIGKHIVFTPEWLGRIRQANIETGKKHSGEKHWNWKGGRTPLIRLLRQTREYREWRLAVYERDRWTCQDCRKHCGRKDIVAHHKKSFKDYRNLRYERDNGVTLCRKCHLKRERIVALSRDMVTV
ncbi:hypothetical protein LCGC14_1023620 [marine sediment metagenome]|uniref:HNH nuclease domain-containing protein n=1 Tax=marine sediment metagenome TaxID=412755 RepID=A0A0F9N173_9ZZZZ